MRWLIALNIVFLASSLLVQNQAYGQESSQLFVQGSTGTVIDLRKYQHIDGTIRPARSATHIPGYSKPQRASEGESTASYDVLVIEPASHLRKVANLREKMRVIVGQNHIGRSDFEISCSIGAAYAHLPGEEIGFRFIRQSDCKALLQSASATEPCRSRLSINRQAKTVTVLGQACGAGPFPVANQHGQDDRPLSDAEEADSLSSRARAARIRAQHRTAR